MFREGINVPVSEERGRFRPNRMTPLPWLSDVTDVPRPPETHFVGVGVVMVVCTLYRSKDLALATDFKVSVVK